MKDIIQHYAEFQEPKAPLSESKLIFLGGLVGLTPSFKGGSGQPLSKAAEALHEDAPRPDFAADAEYIERELFVPEDQD